jgi:hypothetical protein
VPDAFHDVGPLDPMLWCPLVFCPVSISAQNLLHSSSNRLSPLLFLVDLESTEYPIPPFSRASLQALFILQKQPVQIAIEFVLSNVANQFPPSGNLETMQESQLPHFPSALHDPLLKAARILPEYYLGTTSQP